MLVGNSFVRCVGVVTIVSPAFCRPVFAAGGACGAATGHSLQYRTELCLTPQSAVTAIKEKPRAASLARGFPELSFRCPI